MRGKKQKDWRSFEEAREFARSLGLQTRCEWMNFIDGRVLGLAGTLRIYLTIWQASTDSNGKAGKTGKTGSVRISDRSRKVMNSKSFEEKPRN